MRKGLVQPQAQPQTAKPTTHNIRARIVPTKPEPPPQRERSMIVSPNEAPQQHVRGTILDAGGKRLIRGLSQATVQAYRDHNENATEQCKNCGEFKPPAAFQTPVKNAYNPDNPLRICDSCAGLAYKDPFKVEAKQIAPWSPQVPAIRFDRNRGKPYDARAAGLSIRDLVNDSSDTYHREREVAPEYLAEQAPRYGQWSGGGRTGHQVTRTSLERSREAAARSRK